MIFKYLPDVKVPFSKVWAGAIGTALLFTVGKYCLGMYLGRASTTSSYGAAGSVLVIQMWTYYASVILFFGAEFTQVYARRTGTQVIPSKYAEPVTAEESAREGIPRPSPASKAKERGQTETMPQFEPAACVSTPGNVVHESPWQFVSLMLLVGCVGGLLLRLKPLRKALRFYAAVSEP